jgi:putative intracellular protease/amidase
MNAQKSIAPASSGSVHTYSNTATSAFKQLTVLVLLLCSMAAAAIAQTSAHAAPAGRAHQKILIVLSAADNWKRADGSDYPTGYWTEEFVVIHKRFAEAGFTIELATPGGKKPTADPHSLDEQVVGREKALSFAAYLKGIAGSLDHPLALAQVNINNFEAVIIPGGHGPVVDLYKDEDMGKLLFAADKANKIIGTVCHGQAALLSAIDKDGKWLFKGRTMTAFSDEEEVEFGTASNAPWLLASRLRECGADYKRGPKNWSAFVVTDGNMISGQNPASSAPMADAVMEAIR